MLAHKQRAEVTSEREVLVRLPSDFPLGYADIIVLAAMPLTAAETLSKKDDLHQWIDSLPEAPVLAPAAFDRGDWYR